MSTLVGRVAILTVGTIRIDSSDSLRFTFQITKDLKATPNKAVIKVYNLSPTHRRELQSLAPNGIPVQLEAGYKDGISQIFLGTLRVVHTEREGPDFVTTIESGDGEHQIQTSRISTSFAKGTPNKAVLSAVALAVGVAPGNLNDAIAKLSGASVFANGTVCFGSAASEMDRICRSLDLEWSVQHGKLQVLPRGTAVAGKAVRLGDPGGHGSGGLLGSPTIDQKGVMTFRCLMQTDIFPGRLLVLNSQNMQGQYRVEQTVHNGDSRGTQGNPGPWEITGQAKAY